MALSTISNTINPVPPDGGIVIARLIPNVGFRLDGSEVAPRVRTNIVSGAWSLDLERNSDILPSNTYYEVLEDLSPVGLPSRRYVIQVGSSNQDVVDAQVSPVPSPSATTLLTEAEADALYDQSAPSFDSPGSSAPGDVAAEGVDTDAARADHVHGRELWATTVPLGVGPLADAGTTDRVSRGDHFHNPGTLSSAKASFSANQTMAGAPNDASWTAQEYDTDNYITPTSTTFTVPAAGIYLVQAQITFTDGADSTFRSLALAGSVTRTLCNVNAVNGASTAIQGSAILSLAASSTLRLSVNSANTGINMSAGWMAVTRLQAR